MNTVARRICLALLAIYGAYSGLWGYLAPDSWYRDFPGLGLHWVTPFGPDNEHFVKDVNAMFVAVAVLAAIACWRIGSARLSYLAGAAWTTFGVLHLAFHLRHLDMLGPTDRVIGAVSLVVVLVISASLLIPLRAKDPVAGPARTGHRVVLALLGLTGVGTGIWAYVAPENWYATFPGFGHTWLPQLGPYDEHLAVDTGAMFLAFAVLSLIAFVRAGDRGVLRTTGVIWLVFNVLHLIYHLTMLGMYRPADQVLNVVVLVILAVLPLFLLPSVNDRAINDRAINDRAINDRAINDRGGSRDNAAQSGTAASAWEESKHFYSPQEIAALELTEAITVLTDGFVPDEVFERARKHFDDTELAGLIAAITMINSWNRLSVTVRNPPGHYTPAAASAESGGAGNA